MVEVGDGGRGTSWRGSGWKLDFSEYMLNFVFFISELKKTPKNPKQNETNEL